MYNKFVLQPLNNEEVQKHEEVYRRSGFPGCVGSTDATHVIIEKCPHKLHQIHLGYKMSYTARTYNVTVNHQRRILSTTFGHPARFNDKTLIMYDHFMTELKEGKYKDLFQFKLLDYTEGGQVIEKKYNGTYVIVDNGYHKWSVTIPPIKKKNLHEI